LKIVAPGSVSWPDMILSSASRCSGVARTSTIGSAHRYRGGSPAATLQLPIASPSSLVEPKWPT
jgi:hypothetical protein